MWRLKWGYSLLGCDTAHTKQFDLCCVRSVPITNNCGFMKMRYVDFLPNWWTDTTSPLRLHSVLWTHDDSEFDFRYFCQNVRFVCGEDCPSRQGCWRRSSCLTGHHHRRRRRRRLHRRQAEALQFCPTRTLSVDKSIFLSTVHYDRFHSSLTTTAALSPSLPASCGAPSFFILFLTL